MEDVKFFCSSEFVLQKYIFSHFVYTFFEPGAQDLILQQTNGKTGIISFAVPFIHYLNTHPRPGIRCQQQPDDMNVTSII